MRKIVHHEIGEPARVLRLEEGEALPLAPDQVRIRVSCAPIHPGDLLGIMGSPTFGSPPVIGRDGRVPLGIDGVAGEASATVAGALSDFGTLVVYALMSGEPVTIDPLDLIDKVYHREGVLPQRQSVEDTWRV